jgi:hypothetical protein
MLMSSLTRRMCAIATELLDSSLANFKLLGDQTSVQLKINNYLTYPADIVLVTFHFTWWFVGEIVPTKSLADTTYRWKIQKVENSIRSTLKDCVADHVLVSYLR